MAGVDAPQVHAVEVFGRNSGQERKIVIMLVSAPVTKSVSGRSLQVAPCGYGDPTAEDDQCETGGAVDKMSKARSDGDACDPNHRRNGQSREDVPNARLEGSARSLRF